MGHSAEYQTELYIKQLEQMAQNLFDQSKKFRDGGLEDMADSTFEQASQLLRAIGQLRKIMEE
ncbi:hypothetical protein ATI14_1790 [Pseudomonas tolaasii NCPPB 2192]|uniref:Uncharacterized protein n=1 Tax=Pseudomonas tolaasii NCPPB 2192 TaxID=564423 RepID=A0ABX4QDQ3_PSETO|nr:hypothetical protein [Pseudomonas tolaasii]ARB29663.1 hypothetical protein B5P22_20985 [Pseudomonas tolaasii]KAB0466178.1 hypothetical protein F7R12_29255 [Pseudomonas tolaasii]NWC28223.1 hypothetical protein [Pseudomonas tolaasii]PKA74939.1 hypothetical protein ATI14_1790 [Pseudomonas tolaasii NCPPB 2192]